MTAAFVGGEVVLTGTTPVSAVAAPAGGKQREVLSLLAINRDSVSRTIIAKKLKTAGSVSIEVGRAAIAAGLRAQLLSAAVVLDDTDESVTVEADATHTTTAPIVDVSVFEVP